MAGKKRNVWKILSIIFIVLFLFVLLSGLWRAHHFRSPTIKATLTQIDTVRNIAISDMNSKGIDTGNFSFRISDEIRKTPKNTDSRQILEVSANNASVRYMYIIDVNSSSILVYSKTEFYDGLNHTGDGSMDLRDKRRDDGRRSPGVPFLG